MCICQPDTSSLAETNVPNKTGGSQQVSDNSNSQVSIASIDILEQILFLAWNT